MYENIKLVYCLGEEKNGNFNNTEFIEYVNLEGVKNDYHSVGYKQFLGLKYIYENYKTKFIICFGSDTYLNIPKLLSYISNFDYSECLYIGGHGGLIQIGYFSCYFHSGGPGFIITYNVLHLCAMAQRAIAQRQRYLAPYGLARQSRHIQKTLILSAFYKHLHRKCGSDRRS